MFYRETGQFKTSYAADQQIFPIRQDRIGVGLVLAVAFLVVPAMAGEYWFNAILTPFLIFYWVEFIQEPEDVQCRRRLKAINEIGLFRYQTGCFGFHK